MPNQNQTPLLLLDNSSMISLLNKGDFKVSNMTFEETKVLMEAHAQQDIIQCFSNFELEKLIFQCLDMEPKQYNQKKIRNMRLNQGAVVFKLYTVPSQTQPAVQADDGVEAKKIQEVYMYCQYILRID